MKSAIIGKICGTQQNRKSQGKIMNFIISVLPTLIVVQNCYSQETRRFPVDLTYNSRWESELAGQIGYVVPLRVGEDGPAEVLFRIVNSDGSSKSIFLRPDRTLTHDYRRQNGPNGRFENTIGRGNWRYTLAGPGTPASLEVRIEMVVMLPNGLSRIESRVILFQLIIDPPVIEESIDESNSADDEEQIDNDSSESNLSAETGLVLDETVVTHETGAKSMN